jgi:hypothetical protein
MDGYSTRVASSFDHFTDHAVSVATGAAVVGSDWRRKLVTAVDFTVGLLRYPDGNVARWRAESGFDADRAVMSLTAVPVDPQPVAEGQVRFDDDSRRILTAAITHALRSGADHVGTEHFLAATVGFGPPAVIAAFREQGVTADQVMAYVAAMNNDPGVERLAFPPDRDAVRGWRQARSRLDPSNLTVPRTRVRAARRRWFVVGAMVAVILVLVGLTFM